MIWHPKVGQRVRLHYAKAMRAVVPDHGKVGIVKYVAIGPGPINVGVEIDGQLSVVPRGNLVAVR